MAKKSRPKGKTEDKYYFDPAAADRAVNFIERFCHHVKGELAGTLIKLQPWQSTLVREVFGWKNKDGTRKYRTPMALLLGYTSQTT